MNQKIESCPQCREDCKRGTYGVYFHIQKNPDCTILGWSYPQNEVR